ncbi:uncharacterized protein LOC111084323, partial [Limulus polyphemus]|uniref:Uncharacterized protein LOC111084323 n=1 Tax=Limulus polyphemus TaxID=6850 RepID=A0ABM1RZG9_LIMPO
MATSKGQERSEVHELSHKMDNWSHPELREVCSNRPEENDGCFSNISTCCGILNSRVCKSTSSFVVKDGSTKVKGKEKVGKCDCSKKLESNQNTVVKDAVVAVPANLELTKRSESVRSQSLDKVSTTNPPNLKLTPGISVDKVGCSNISESVRSQSLDKVSTTNPANLKLTPEISVDNVGCSKEFDLRLKKCTENKFNDEQNHSNIQEFKDVSECMNNTKQHRGLGMNTRSVCSEPVPSQSDIVKDVRLLNLPSLPAKTDKIRPSKNQNREQYEYDSSTSFDHTSFSCSKEINNGNIATVSFLTGDASPELKNTVLSAGNMFMNESFVASFSSLRSETPSNIKGAEPGDAPSLQSLKQKFETSGGVDLTSVGGTVRDSHGSFVSLTLDIHLFNIFMFSD